ncbi:hypothetical protein K435DRAFT_67956 [Dendrothele bispora CBS 962.96]|uniref:Uncharacterized protein n=1 Tax=Dendrothele bispora (strain CBS 962.96) TaxID=1314807 RepID=A0A4V4HB65_DENBC|nr:hypothetical protein K435DRAFT_67956 [Dendrothele bispora CBS 962.96]
MKFSFGLATAFALFAVSVAAKGSTSSTPSQSVCDAAKQKKGTYNGHTNDEVCSFLIDDCMDETASTSNIWSIPSCVAGATCGGTHNLIQLAKCTNSDINEIVSSDLTSLDYDLYAEIVGDCAWQSGGCPMTRQNYIDFFYSTLDDTCSDVWPGSIQSVIDNWSLIADWTAKGPESIPYLNFNDWLQWSDSQ